MRPRPLRNSDDRALPVGKVHDGEVIPPGVVDRFRILSPKQWEAVHMLGGPQRHSLLVGGSRSGKTFLLCTTILHRALAYPGSRHAIFRHRQNAVRASIGQDTLPKVRKLLWPGVKWKENKTLGFYVLPNGSEIWLCGLDDKERVEKILGLEFASLYFNETSQIPFTSVDVALTRLAQSIDHCTQRAYYDLNPGGNLHWTYRQFFLGKMADGRRDLPDFRENYRAMFLNPKDNPHLSKAYLDSLSNASERTRRRFFEGVYSPEMDGALWTIEAIDKMRVEPITPAAARTRFQRIVIGVDPSGTKGDPDERSDDVGIVVLGREPVSGGKGQGGVLEDGTLNANPAKWAKQIADLTKKWSADCVVAEKNFGGEMVAHTIATADPYARVKLVNASKAKHIRAEPVSAEYEKGRILHYGRFDELEDEMLQMSQDGYHGPRSPNRLDALVFAAAELFGHSMVPDDALAVVIGDESVFASEQWVR